MKIRSSYKNLHLDTLGCVVVSKFDKQTCKSDFDSH